VESSAQPRMRPRYRAFRNGKKDIFLFFIFVLVQFFVWFFCSFFHCCTVLPCKKSPRKAADVDPIPFYAASLGTLLSSSSEIGRGQRDPLLKLIL